MNIEEMNIQEISEYLQRERGYDTVVLGVSKQKLGKSEEEDFDELEFNCIGGIGVIALLEMLKFNLLNGYQDADIEEYDPNNPDLDIGSDNDD